MICLIITLLIFGSVNCQKFPSGLSLTKPSCNNHQGDSRIVGGENAPIRYPYVVSLQMQSRGGGPGFFFFQQPRSNYSHFCGGSIVNEDHIVTAAHCIQGFNVSRLSVFAGVNDLRDEEHGTRRFIDNCVINPDYVELNNSDIAVCKLKTPLVFSENISAITLSSEYVGGGVNCTLVGWGYTSMIRGTPLPNNLQRAFLPTITNQECNERGQNVGPREICTMSRFGVGACGGDSGGPLTCNDALAGIVSYGSRICAMGVPDVYTRASEYIDFIEENSM
ncbi:hypothetical protein PVAND_011573 [Polypedilum vanderplanki]|uniref:Peptidase S1 domain-containing protein n=1 Tax=Polypedilum vanderplanki TaxID=319348 RepID=A0A9J6CK13_POLVA|nr:hypothetical protein PVAND_011573 [Polypedilum vanderplanki]